jgi:hypothetical protein
MKSFKFVVSGAYSGGVGGVLALAVFRPSALSAFLLGAVVGVLISFLATLAFEFISQTFPE